ncbi:MAG: Cof-type HAD-IIB family hydrolase [Clostridia bacterium]|nr:Cof-type HAD-IIB family hydrolase [Clostridia bacterium]
MIKFIASDLDGTLLPPSKIMPEETFPLIEKLYSRGIIFAPASGRQLPNLKKLFEPILDKIAIIAENGGIGWYKGEVVYSNPTPKESVKRALEVIRKEKDLYPLLSCADCAYYDSDFAPFIEISQKSYSNIKRASLDEVADSETVIKISVWDGKPPCAEHGGIILPPKLQGLRVMVSGYDWLDVSVLNANKGNALKALLKICKIEKGESMAFGDHMNDLEMLLESGHPFVTANAFSGLKEHIKNTVPSNAENGVIQKIKEIL